MKLLILLVLSSVCTIVSGQTILPTTGAGITYENRTDMLNAPDCNPSEMYLKKKVKAEVAKTYKDYPLIAVDFTSFKGQNGYSDKKIPNRFVYPYKIELFVYLKRKVIKEKKEKTEISTWEYDAVYEYATTGKKCDFRMVPSSKTKLISTKLY